MKIFRALGVLFLAGLMVPLVGCESTSKKADIVTTLFAHYDFAKQIVGNTMSVSLLIPPGSEAHDYEPSSQDLEAIREAKLFVFTSLEMDPWLGENPSQFIGDDSVMINMHEALMMDEVAHLSDHDHEHNDELHYWTDPEAARTMIEILLEQILLINPAHANEYQANASAYQQTLWGIEDTFSTYLETLSNPPIIYFAGHNALGAFGSHFGIEIVTLSDTNQPDADLTSAQIEQLIQAIQAAGAHTLFTEELKEPRIAQTIQRELLLEQYPLNLLELHAYHNVTKTQLESGYSYADIFEQNVNHLMTALGGDNA